MSGIDRANEIGGGIGSEGAQEGNMRRVESAINEAMISAYCKENKVSYPII